jgi:basic membrane protein A
MKKISVVFTILVAAVFLLSACGPAANATPKIKIGEVTDMGGVNDKSFNALGWKGVTDAISQLGVEGKYLESSQQSDYAKNIQQMLTEKQDLIITVGYHIAEYPPFLWNGKQDKTILNIDFVESEPDPYFNPAVEVIGDISHSLRNIGERISV